MPAVQDKHAPLAPEKPALQTHEVIVVLPLGDIVLAGQLVHGILPETLLYLPCAQTVHVTTFSLDVSSK